MSVLYRIKIIICVIFLFIFSCSKVFGQEYKYEIGGMAGMSMYMGDANKNNIFMGWHPSVGAVFRKNINFRWALKADLLMGSVSGDTKNTDNAFPHEAEVSFYRNFYELGVQAEFNFLPYSDKFAYLQTSKLSPYLLLGIGLTTASGKDTFWGVNLPVGIGLKYKMRNRINLGVEYSFRKLFADDFDAPSKQGFNLDNPYQIESSLWKNKDWYSLLMFSLTWDFGPNDRKCATE